MSSGIKLKWQVSDGFPGGDREHVTVVFAEEFNPSLTDKEIEVELYKVIQTEFARKVYPVQRNIDSVIEAIRLFQEDQKDRKE